MPISMTNKPQLTGILILFIGCGLLAFTFINAFLFLQEPLSILATGDLARVFGDALAPLIQACIRLMYLGIMGWIGSLLTVRGIPLVTHKPTQVATPKTIPEIKSETIEKPQPAPRAPQPKQPAIQPQAETEPISPEEPKAILISPENQKEE
ncbi:MAG: hypothetical protein JSV05_01995 [Candidatus Bathyarchaeota archaeon]|nr:MAG: hypothetical protein JSV05_01995 [Candidatus Bathyarchaeota archaeon]